MTQSNEGFYRRDHPDTAKAAAERAANFKPRQFDRVRDDIWAQKDEGRTDEEQQLALAMNPSSQRPRRIENVEAGNVKDSGRRRNSSIVWIEVPEDERADEAAKQQLAKENKSFDAIRLANVGLQAKHERWATAFDAIEALMTSPGYAGRPGSQAVLNLLPGDFREE